MEVLGFILIITWLPFVSFILTYFRDGDAIMSLWISGGVFVMVSWIVLGIGFMQAGGA